MTAAMSGRSLGTAASPSIIEAMVSTSYGVRFFERAYLMLTLSQFRQNAASCAFTS